MTYGSGHMVFSGQVFGSYEKEIPMSTMKRPDVRVVLLTLVLVVFFPLYGCMVIAPVSLLTLSMLTTKVPFSWWLVLINPLIMVGIAFNYLLAHIINFVLIKRFRSDRGRNWLTLLVILIIALIPFLFDIYGWAGPRGEGEWANFIEFYRKAVR